MNWGDPRLPTRFWNKAVPCPMSGCWIWIGGSKEGRYGCIGWPGAKDVRRAHRVAFEVLVGPIPEGMEIDHRCRLTWCVNPDHLRAVTHQVNTLSGIGPTAVNALKTHCPKGHPLVPSNLRKIADGRRGCLQCKRERSREYDRRRRAKNMASIIDVTASTTD